MLAPMMEKFKFVKFPFLRIKRRAFDTVLEANFQPDRLTE